MALTAQGFAGSVDEVAVATIQGDLPTRIVRGFEVTPNGNSRQTLISAGLANSHGVSVLNDQQIIRTYAIPTNGQWYLTCLRRTWNGNGVTAKVEIVDLAGAATASGAADPVVPPSAFPTVNLNPGVIEDTPLAWVWVSGTATKTIVFDARMTADGAGGISVPNPWVLNALVNAGYIIASRTLGGSNFNDAPAVSMAQFGVLNASASTDVVRSSRWVARAGNGVTGVYRPLHRLRVSTLAALTALTALLDGSVAGSLQRANAFTFDTQAFVEATQSVYAFVGTGNCYATDAAAAAAWQVWEKPLAVQTSGVSNITLGSGGTFRCYWSVAAGIAHFHWVLQFGTSPGMSTSGDVVFTLPTPVMGEVAQGSGKWQAGASGTTGDNQKDVTIYPVNATPGASTTSARVRMRQAASATAAIRQNLLGAAGVSPTAGDLISGSMSAPAASAA